MVESAAETTPEEIVRGAWTWWQRVLFRFSFLFWGKFCLQLGVVWVATGWIPGMGWINRWVLRWPESAIDWPVTRLQGWFVTKLFHLTGEAATWHRTGSGDTALSWIGALSVLVFAIAGAALWTVIAEWGIARRGWRREYRTLYAWLRLAMRFTLASILLGYGFEKVFDLQFSPPGPMQLGRTFGASSPMGLLWTFIGFSVPYTIFAGVAEVVPGMLLLFRRTMTVGALSAAAVLLNVVLLNFCYDVPVKLYSSLYLLMALFLLLPDVIPMWRFFFLRGNERLQGVWLAPMERKPLRIAAYCLQAVVIGQLLYMQISSSYQQWSKRLPVTAAVPQKATNSNPQYANVDGSWVVDSSAGWPPGEQWKTVTIGQLRYQSIDFFEVTREDGMQQNFGESMDWEHKIHFLNRADSVLHWTLDAKGIAMLEGTWQGQPAKLTMHPQPDAQGSVQSFPLLTGRFHWVQEYPYNR
jgi:hypothetical protein